MQPGSARVVNGKCHLVCRLHKGTFVAGEDVAGFLSIITPEFDLAINAAVVTQVTVQSHGHARVDPRWIQLPKALENLYSTVKDAIAVRDGQKTRDRFSEFDDSNTICIYATNRSEIELGLEDNLQVGWSLENTAQVESSKIPSRTYAGTFLFKAPKDCPPSFKGTIAKYFYFVTVTVKIAKRTPPEGRWNPFQSFRRQNYSETSLTSYETISVHVPYILLGSVAASESLPPALTMGKIFLQREVEDQVQADEDRQFPANSGTLLSRTHASIWDLQGKWRGGTEGHPLVFAVRSGECRILKFMLYKREFWPGDILLGSFDFTDSDCSCHQICACLLMEECATDDWTTSTTKDTASTSSSHVHQRIVDVFHEYSTGAMTSNMMLSVPSDASLSFRTDLIEVRWVLKFEFTIEKSKIDFSGDLSEELNGSTPLNLNSGREISFLNGGSSRSSLVTAGNHDPEYSVLRWEVQVEVVSPSPSTEPAKIPFRSQEGSIERNVSFI